MQVCIYQNQSGSEPVVSLLGLIFSHYTVWTTFVPAANHRRHLWSWNGAVITTWGFYKYAQSLFVCKYCILHTEHNWTWSWGEIKLFFKTHILISDCLTPSLLFRTSQRHMLNNMCWCDNFLFVFYFLQYVAEKEAGNCLDNNTERVTKGKILGFYFILLFYKMTRNRRPLLDSGDM